MGFGFWAAAPLCTALIVLALAPEARAELPGPTSERPVAVRADSSPEPAASFDPGRDLAELRLASKELEVAVADLQDKAAALELEQQRVRRRNLYWGVALVAAVALLVLRFLRARAAHRG